MLELFTSAEVEYKVAVLELIIDGLIVSAIWQVLSHFASKRHEKYLEEKLDDLYEKLKHTEKEVHAAKKQVES